MVKEHLGGVVFALPPPGVNVRIRETEQSLRIELQRIVSKGGHPVVKVSMGADPSLITGIVATRPHYPRRRLPHTTQVVFNSIAEIERRRGVSPDEPAFDDVDLVALAVGAP